MSKRDPDADAAEVRSWPDGKLQAIVYKIGQGTFPRGLTLRFEPFVIEELARRGLDAAHVAYQTKCVVCGKKALYRVGRSVFCTKHKTVAVAKRQVADATYNEREDLKSREFTRVRTARDSQALDHDAARKSAKFRAGKAVYRRG